MQLLSLLIPLEATTRISSLLRSLRPRRVEVGRCLARRGGYSVFARSLGRNDGTDWVGELRRLRPLLVLLLLERGLLLLVLGILERRVVVVVVVEHVIAIECGRVGESIHISSICRDGHILANGHPAVAEEDQWRGGSNGGRHAEGEGGEGWRRQSISDGWVGSRMSTCGWKCKGISPLRSAWHT